MVSLRTLALLYMAHLRARPLPELLALLGIAAGVALLFAVQVANNSLTGSFEELAEGVAGRASLEVVTRKPQGFNQEVFSKVERLSSVEIAAPIVEQRIAVKGPKGQRPLTLFGFDERLKRMKGKFVIRIARQRDVSDLGLYLTEPTARAIGVAPGRAVTIKVGERTKRLPLAGIVPADEIGSLAQSPVAIAHLGLAQEIASMPGRISRILVAPVPGREDEAEAALRKASTDTLNVRASNTEAKLLKEAAAPYIQSSALFSSISLVVGILLAYNAMLLTLTSRRRAIAGMHALGATNRTIITSLAFDALVLGVAGSLLGILLGDLLSRLVLNDVPGFLSSAFAIGDQRLVDSQVIILSVLGGTLAALAAAARPAINLLKTAPLGTFSERGQDAIEIRSSTVHWKTLGAGIALVALSLAFFLILPQTTIFMVAVLILGMVLILPPLVIYLLSVSIRIARRTNSAALRVAAGELIAAPIRATALAGVGALALFAILSITGPARDMERGIGQGVHTFFGNADIWISPNLEENPFITQPFNHKQVSDKVRQLPQVMSVRVSQGSFFDLDNRRIWIIGESPSARYPIAPSQIIKGDLKTATQKFRQGGWAALTETIVKERNLMIGDRFSLPTPSGKRQFRLAATITNYAWPSGALIINARDYRRAWNTQQASALGVDLADGVTNAEGKVAIQQALGGGSALSVQTADESRTIIATTTSQAVARLNQIADMVLVAAVLAVVAAMLGSVWQRRQRLWGLVSLGMAPRQLYRTIFFETGVILLIGCVIGIAFGFLGQAFGGRWLHFSTAHPVPFEPAWGLALKTLILAITLAGLSVVMPIRFVFSKNRVADLSSK